MNIFFDLDGTLIDTSERNYAVYKKIVSKFNAKPLEKTDYWELKRNRAPIHQILKLSKIPMSQHKFFIQAFFKEIENRNYLKLDNIFPFTLSVLDDLMKLKYNLYLLSYRRYIDRTLQELIGFKLNKKFKEIKIGRINNSGSKTKTEFIKQTGSNINDIIVGDTEDEIIVAHDLKLICVSVLSGIRNRSFLNKLEPNFIIENISFLPALIKEKILQKT